jgi:RNA polymerase sigma-70 factor (ECF subfamily)
MSLSSGPTTPEQLLLRREIRKAFAEATDRLPASWREVISRCALSGISVSEMAQALGLSLAATKSRLFRARSQMRTDLACFHNADL